LLVIGGVRQARLLSLCLVTGLAMAACTSAAVPKLTDLVGGETQAKVEVAPDPSSMAQQPPGDAGLSPGANSPAPPAGTAALPSSARASIVGFKASTVVLFSGEFGNEGERVATSSLALPLQTTTSPSNAGRVQIETVYGLRWIARTEVVLGIADRQRPGRALQ